MSAFISTTRTLYHDNNEVKVVYKGKIESHFKYLSMWVEDGEGHGMCQTRYIDDIIHNVYRSHKENWWDWEDVLRCPEKWVTFVGYLLEEPEIKELLGKEVVGEMEATIKASNA